jgi:hypothetical protein
MRRPNYLGLVTLGWDDKPRSGVCTHSEHQACTVKILQSLCVSHKIVETYKNQHAPKFLKRENGMMRQWQHWPVLSQDDTYLLRTGQNIGQAPWAFDRTDMCAIKVVSQSINQSNNRSIRLVVYTKGKSQYTKAKSVNNRSIRLVVYTKGKSQYTKAKSVNNRSIRLVVYTKGKSQYTKAKSLNKRSIRLVVHVHTKGKSQYTKAKSVNNRSIRLVVYTKGKSQYTNAKISQ